VILDEAFSAMDAATRDKCMTFLAHGETYYLSESETGDKDPEVHKTNLAMSWKMVITGLEARQALICVSHLSEEVPDMVTEWMCLPEPNEGKPVRFGTRGKSKVKDRKWWDIIWNL